MKHLCRLGHLLDPCFWRKICRMFKKKKLVDVFSHLWSRQNGINSHAWQCENAPQKISFVQKFNIDSVCQSAEQSARTSIRTPTLTLNCFLLSSSFRFGENCVWVLLDENNKYLSRKQKWTLPERKKIFSYLTLISGKPKYIWKGHYVMNLSPLTHSASWGLQMQENCKQLHPHED